MSLPNYIINLPELAKIIQDTIRYDKNIEHKGLMSAKGFLIEKEDKKSRSWNPSHDLLLTGVKIKYGDNRNISRVLSNGVNLWVNGEVVINNLSVKESDDFVRMRQFIPIKKNSLIDISINEMEYMDTDIEIILEYINTSVSGTKVNVKCVNIDLESDSRFYIIKEQTLLFFPTKYVDINAPKIEGFELVGKEKEKVFINIGNEGIDVIFTYRAVDKKVEITHMMIGGYILEQYSESIKPPTSKTYKGKEFPSLFLISDEIVMVEIKPEDSSIIPIFFYYQGYEKYIRIRAIDKKTNEILKDTTDATKNYPSQYNVVAPIIEGYRVIGDSNIIFDIGIESPNMNTFDFFYHNINDEEEPEEPEDIDHDYDIKVVLRWENNSQVDLDLNTSLVGVEGSNVYFGNKKYETREGAIWLDKDHLKHGADGFVKEPEIGSLEGFKEGVWSIRVINYNKKLLTQNALIDIFSVEDKKQERKIASFTIDKNKINQYYHCLVCEIDIASRNVKEKMVYS